MKPSHLTTPRTLADGVWIASADPLDFNHKRTPNAWTVADVIVAALAAATAVAIWLGAI